MPRVLSAVEIEAFRERLCDAAEILFAEHGAEAVTIRQMAAELAVSPMTPYRYFKDKDAILAAVRARAFDRFAAALEAACASRAGEPAARAEPIGRAYVRFAFDHPQAYKLMFDITQPGEERYPDLVRASERARATMTLHLDRSSGQAGPDRDTELLGRAYWAALHGPIMLEFSGKLEPTYNARVLIEVLTRALDQWVLASRRDP